MSADDEPPYSPAWLGLRESADARSRSPELLRTVCRDLAGLTRPVIHDLGCGTGSMGRWLAGRLPGPQHWVMYDHDPELLEHARAHMVAAAADGARVTVATRQRDVTALTAEDLAGASLVTASALLDLLTRDEVDRLAAACVDAACPALLTLSVVGRVKLTPADPLDTAFGAAFNAHQCRDVDGRRLLGPDAADATAEAFTRLGATVSTRPSPWLLGPDQVTLAVRWLRGWVAAACQQQPELTARAGAYLEGRLAAAETGGLSVVIDHLDILARFE